MNDEEGLPAFSYATADVVWPVMLCNADVSNRNVLLEDNGFRVDIP